MWSYIGHVIVMCTIYGAKLPFYPRLLSIPSSQIHKLVNFVSGLKYVQSLKIKIYPKKFLTKIDTFKIFSPGVDLCFIMDKPLLGYV
jgi:hypothetical protein